MKSLKDRVVAITGASAGVGRATAVEFAKRGARVGLIARGRERLEAAQKEIEALGSRAVVAPADVASFAQVEEAASLIERTLGPIDIWVNNAMSTIFAPVLQITPEEYKRATEVTYLGAVHGTMAALARMRTRNRGVIVQVGSALAYRAIPLQAPYCGAKHAMRGFTDSLRCELMHDKVRVRLTMVQLPALNTPQFDWCKSRMPNRPQPVPPIFQPEVAARAIVWAATHRRREVHVGWPAVKTIWGNKLAPRTADRILADKGYSGQQTDEPARPDRPNNLFEPVPGDYGAHGRFDHRSRDRSIQLWITTHRAHLAAAALGLAAVFAGFWAAA